jgi:hypothetical protein
MGQYNHSVRHQRLYTQDNEGKQIFAKDCIPEERPTGSWTKGVKAWKKGEQGAPDVWVGWFHPPRFKKGKSTARNPLNQVIERNRPWNEDDSEE